MNAPGRSFETSGDVLKVHLRRAEHVRDTCGGQAHHVSARPVLGSRPPRSDGQHPPAPKVIIVGSWQKSLEAHLDSQEKLLAGLKFSPNTQPNSKTLFTLEMH